MSISHEIIIAVWTNFLSKLGSWKKEHFFLFSNCEPPSCNKCWIISFPDRNQGSKLQVYGLLILHNYLKNIFQWSKQIFQLENQLWKNIYQVRAKKFFPKNILTKWSRKSSFTAQIYTIQWFHFFWSWILGNWAITASFVWSWDVSWEKRRYIMILEIQVYWLSYFFATNCPR